MLLWWPRVATAEAPCTPGQAGAHTHIRRCLCLLQAPSMHAHRPIASPPFEPPFDLNLHRISVSPVVVRREGNGPPVQFSPFFHFHFFGFTPPPSCLGGLDGCTYLRHLFLWYPGTYDMKTAEPRPASVSATLTVSSCRSSSGLLVLPFSSSLFQKRKLDASRKMPKIAGDTSRGKTNSRRDTCP